MDALDFLLEPRDVETGIVTARLFSGLIRRARYVDDVYQDVGVTEVVEEAVAATPALASARHQTGHVLEQHRHQTLTRVGVTVRCGK